MHIQRTTMAVMITLSMLAMGCNGKKEEAAPTPTTPATDAKPAGRPLLPHEKVVQEFINAAFKGDDAAAFALITPAAQEAYKSSGVAFQPFAVDNVKCQITGSSPIEGTPDAYGVYLTMTDLSEDGAVFDTVWGVKKINNEYRISALMISEDENNVTKLDFENPVESARALPGAMPQPGQTPAPAGTGMPPQQGTAAPFQQVPVNQPPMQIDQAPQQTPPNHLVR